MCQNNLKYEGKMHIVKNKYIDMIKDFCQKIPKGVELVPKTIVELWVLTDKYGRIYYSGATEEMAQNYKESNSFNDKHVIKLTGEIKNV